MPQPLFLKDKALIKAPPDLCVIGQSLEPKFRVHKLILMCISPYFQKLFLYRRDLKKLSFPDEVGQQQLLEYIQLDLVNPSVLSVILDYAYSGQVKMDLDRVQDLVIAADMYDIHGLVEEATTFLKSCLNPLNCIGIFSFAQAYNCLELETSSKRYILKNFERIWPESEEFLSLMDVNLLQTLLSSNFSYTKDELSNWQCLIKWIQYDSLSRLGHFEALADLIRFGLIGAYSLQQEVLCHPFIESHQRIKNLINEVILARSMLEAWERPTTSPVHLTASVKKQLVPRFPKDIIFVFGGRALDVEFVSPEKEVESYDHRAERWRKVPLEDPSGPRDHHQVAVIDQCIYVLGGHHGPINVYNSCRRLNLNTREWQEIAPMREKRAFHASVIFNDHIFAIGGYNGSWRVDTVEKYDVNLNQWSAIASMNERRSGAGATVLDGKIYVAGGFRDLSYLSTAECYNPVTNVWTMIADMNKSRSSPAVVALNGHVYVIGGLSNHGLLSCAERYDPRTDQWTIVEGEMVEKKCSAAAVVMDGKILVIGGWNGIGGLRTVEIWCDQSKSWCLGTKLIKRRTGCAACVVHDITNIEDYAYPNRESVVQERIMNALGLSDGENQESRKANVEENLEGINRNSIMASDAPNRRMDRMELDRS